MRKFHKIILGIDPGFADTGFGVIKNEGQIITHLSYGSIKTHSKAQFPDRLFSLHNELKEIIKKYQPSLIAIEKLFFAQNTKTAIDVGQARGVILLTAIQEKKEIVEFTPLQVKLAITGYGRADKKQIQEMVRILLQLKIIPHPDDAADALAIAICASRHL